jgi:hypothetical protein
MIWFFAIVGVMTLSLSLDRSRQNVSVVGGSLLLFLTVLLCSHYFSFFMAIVLTIVAEALLAVIVINSDWKYSNEYFWLIFISFSTTFIYGYMMISKQSTEGFENAYFATSEFLTVAQLAFILAGTDGSKNKIGTGFFDSDFFSISRKYFSAKVD